MPSESLLRYWTLHSPNGDVATCELVRTPAGLEVRCELNADSARARVARAATVRAISDALNLAEAWKASYVAQGWMIKAVKRRTAR